MMRLWFPDGNGRVARILLDAMLKQAGLTGVGLWSMSRALAKSDDRYKDALAGADHSRMSDLDGRGNLSERKFADFGQYMLEVALDQVKFMRRMFALEDLEPRARGYFERVRVDLKTESAHLYIHALRSGEFERMEAARITGKPDRTARDILAALLDEDLLVSDTPRGKVRAGFPPHALGTLFPNLYPMGDLDTRPYKKAGRKV